MPSNTVAQLAEEMKMPANVLLEHFRSAGVELGSVDDGVTDADKAALLEALRRSHGTDQGKKVTLTRRKRSEEHTSELQSLMRISNAVSSLNTKNTEQTTQHTPSRHTS